MKKKIIVGTSLGLVLALALTVIILACVTKSYKPELDLQPKTVTIVELSTKDEFESGVAFSNNEKFEELLNKYDESFKQNVLSGIFSGNLSKDIQVKLMPGGNKLPTFSNGYTITFEYKNEMVLKVNGETYYHESHSDKEVLFSTVIFNVTDIKGYSTFNMYAKEVVGNKTYYYEISTIANTQNLYSYLTELSYS